MSTLQDFRTCLSPIGSNLLSPLGADQLVCKPGEPDPTICGPNPCIPDFISATLVGEHGLSTDLIQVLFSPFPLMSVSIADIADMATTPATGQAHVTSSGNPFKSVCKWRMGQGSEESGDWHPLIQSVPFGPILGYFENVVGRILPRQWVTDHLIQTTLQHVFFDSPYGLLLSSFTFDDQLSQWRVTANDLTLLLRRFSSGHTEAEFRYSIGVSRWAEWEDGRWALGAVIFTPVFDLFHVVPSFAAIASAPDLGEDGCDALTSFLQTPIRWVPIGSGLQLPALSW